MTEVESQVELLLEFTVIHEKDVVVEGDRLHLRISLLHAFQAVQDGPRRDGQDLFKERVSVVAIDGIKHHAHSRSSGDDEVSLHVSDALPIVDSLGSFVDHALSDHHSPLAASFPSGRVFLACSLDLPAVWTCNISPQGRRGYVWQILAVLPDEFGSHLGRLIVEEKLIRTFPKIDVRDDLHADRLRIPALHIRVVLGVCRVIPPSFPRSFLELVRNRAVAYTRGPFDVAQRISLVG